MKPGNKEWTGFRFFSFSGSQTRLGSPGTDELRRGCELRAPKETRRARVGSDKPPNSKRHGRALARGITINPWEAEEDCKNGIKGRFLVKTFGNHRANPSGRD